MEGLSCSGYVSGGGTVGEGLIGHALEGKFLLGYRNCRNRTFFCQKSIKREMVSEMGSGPVRMLEWTVGSHGM